MLPFRTCQRTRRSSSFSPDAVGHLQPLYFLESGMYNSNCKLYALYFYSALYDIFIYISFLSFHVSFFCPLQLYELVLTVKLFFTHRHSLLSLHEDSRDTEGNRGFVQEHLWQIFISEDEGERNQMCQMETVHKL